MHARISEVLGAVYSAARMRYHNRGTFACFSSRQMRSNSSSSSSSASSNSINTAASDTLKSKQCAYVHSELYSVFLC
jgi:hypothetical protein